MTEGESFWSNIWEKSKTCNKATTWIAQIEKEKKTGKQQKWVGFTLEETQKSNTKDLQLENTW